MRWAVDRSAARGSAEQLAHRLKVPSAPACRRTEARLQSDLRHHKRHHPFDVAPSRRPQVAALLETFSTTSRSHHQADDAPQRGGRLRAGARPAGCVGGSSAFARGIRRVTGRARNSTVKRSRGGALSPAVRPPPACNERPARAGCPREVVCQRNDTRNTTRLSASGNRGAKRRRAVRGRASPRSRRGRRSTAPASDAMCRPSRVLCSKSSKSMSAASAR